MHTEGRFVTARRRERSEVEMCFDLPSPKWTKYNEACNLSIGEHGPETSE